MTTVVSPFTTSKTYDVSILNKNRIDLENKVTVTSAIAAPISVIVVGIMTMAGLAHTLWLIPLAIFALFAVSVSGVNIHSVRKRKKVLKDSAVIPWQLNDHLQGLRNAILNVSDEKRGNFRDLWDSAVAQCRELEEPSTDEIRIVNSFLSECTSTVIASRQAEAELIQIISKADPNDPQVVEVREAFQLAHTSTQALEEVKINLQAMRDATREFRTKAEQVDF